MDSMIDRKNILNLLKIFDDRLTQNKEKKEFTIFGSASLLLQKIARDTRSTVDMDLIEPMMDNALNVLSAEVGDEVGLKMGWLNSAGHIFSRNFPKDWQKRTHVIYSGTSLVVKSLGRKDLIATKFNAYCDRDYERDLFDLIDLAPSKAELTYAKKWILGLGKIETERVEKCVKIVLDKTRDRARER